MGSANTTRMAPSHGAGEVNVAARDASSAGSRTEEPYRAATFEIIKR
jgi:hypothetical protein